MFNLKKTTAEKSPSKQSNAAPAETKKAKVIDLLMREEGATIVDLTKATGWQPHTVRAALTRLRHDGCCIMRIYDKKTGNIYKIDAKKAQS